MRARASEVFERAEMVIKVKEPHRECEMLRQGRCCSPTHLAPTGAGEGLMKSGVTASLRDRHGANGSLPLLTP